MANQVNSQDFGTWTLPFYPSTVQIQLPVAGGAHFIVVPPQVTCANGLAIIPWNTNATIKINDGAHTETVTVTAIDTVTYAPNYKLSATFVYPHIAGCIVSSGTQGQQEAINYVQANGGGQIYCVMQELITLSTSGATTDSTAKLIPANCTVEDTTMKSVQDISGNAISQVALSAKTDNNLPNLGVLTTLTGNGTATMSATTSNGVGSAFCISTAADKVTLTGDQTPTQGSVLVTVYSTITVA